jgi:hypothetical protein
VECVSNQVLARPDEYREAGQVVLAVAMPPYARSDRAQAMSGVALLIVEKELLPDRLFEKTLLTCSW